MKKLLTILIIFFSLTLIAKENQKKLISNPIKSVSMAFAGDGGSIGLELIDTKKKKHSYMIDGGLGSKTKGKVFVRKDGNRRILNPKETKLFKELLIKLMKKNVSNCKQDMKEAIQTIK